MLVIFYYILLANLILSIISLVSVLFLSVKPNVLQKLVNYLVSFSIGTLLGGAFLHLFVEGLEQLPLFSFLSVFVITFLLFFVLEKVFSFIHCHKVGCKTHEFGYLNLVGDFFHNFTDGIAITVSFLGGISAGISTTIALSMHELPQEIGDFGVLIKAGFKNKTAVLLNFLVSFSSLVGSVVALMFFNISNTLALYLIPVSAASMVYIAIADLIPVVYKQSKTTKQLIYFITTALIGVLVVGLV